MASKKKPDNGGGDNPPTERDLRLAEIMRWMNRAFGGRTPLGEPPTPAKISKRKPEPEIQEISSEEYWQREDRERQLEDRKQWSQWVKDRAAERDNHDLPAEERERAGNAINNAAWGACGGREEHERQRRGDPSR